MPLAELGGRRGRASSCASALADYVRDYQKTLQHNRRHLLGRYQLVDVAHKVVGVGSVGTRSWIALLLGRDDDDPLFLQVKEAERVGARALRRAGAGSDNQGQRVVEGQRLMQAASDVFLGWLRVDADLDGAPRDYYVRQLWDAKGSVPIEAMPAAELARLRRALWLDARPRPRALGRPRRDRALPRPRRRASTARSPRSPRPTPTRTSATTTALAAAVKSGVVPADRGR